MAWDYRFYERLALAEENAARRALTPIARERHEQLAQRYRSKLDELGFAALRNQALGAAELRARALHSGAQDGAGGVHLKLVSTSSE